MTGGTLDLGLFAGPEDRVTAGSGGVIGNSDQRHGAR